MVAYFFEKGELLEITDKRLLDAVDKVRAAKDQLAAIEMATAMVAGKFKSGRFKTYTLISRSFEKDPNVLWSRSGYMHCTQQNYLVRLLLVKSGWVKDEDMKLGYSLVWYVSPHQYLKIKTKSGWLAVDPWNYAHGAKVGEYAIGWTKKRLRK